MLPRLGHGPVRRRHHQHRSVHLGGARDHVLDVVGMPRAVHVGIVPLLCLVFGVKDLDRQTPLFLFRRRVDLLICQLLRHAYLRQHVRDSRRQRRLAVVHMSDRPYVDMRLRSLEFCLSHRSVTPCLG